MSRSIGNCIADSLALSLGYAEKMLKDVPADKFARLAEVGGVTVHSNHPAFIYGHLALYSPRVTEELGGDASAITPPDSFEAVFSQKAQCQDDPDGTIYPSMSEITETFFAGYQVASEMLRSVSDEALQAPNPAGGRLTELFPTLASAHAFYVGGHMMIHLGQASAWRRMIGLGPA